MLTPVRPPTLSFERRRGELERATSMQGQNFKVNYFLDVKGTGGMTAEVNFPVKFQERPSVSFGGELGAGSPVTAGSFPTISVVVGQWKISPLYSHQYYEGATLVIVVGGTVTQTMTVHFQAEGKALVSPA